MSQRHFDRRGFLATAGTFAAGAFALDSARLFADDPAQPALAADAPVPSFLASYAELYRKDPRQARLEWFTKSKFGLFIHYGLYSLLGRGEWAMFHDKIPVAEYAKLKDKFTADKFDADKITDLMLAAEMKYVTLTSRHHDSFSLFRTSQSDFNSVDSPAKRDLVGELAEACRKKGLGLFLYYSYAADWRHSYFYAPTAGWKMSRPQYGKPDPAYLWKKDEDSKIYIDFVHAQLREILTQYGTLAGIWFDPIRGYYSRPDLFPIEETYALVRKLQPGCLISFKQGANGDEDFTAPERDAFKKLDTGRASPEKVAKNQGKPIEVCNTLQPNWWGYQKEVDGKHRTADEVMAMLAEAKEKKANLLLNTGPLGDGSISPEDDKTLREVGRRLRVGG